MKDIIIIGVILALVIGGSIYTSNYYEEFKNNVDEKLNYFVDTIDTEINLNKEEKIKELEDLWKEKENTLIVFEEHDSIDDIEGDLYECMHYYRTNQKDRLVLYKEKLIGKLEDLIKREKLLLVNIF